MINIKKIEDFISTFSIKNWVIVVLIILLLIKACTSNTKYITKDHYETVTTVDTIRFPKKITTTIVKIDTVYKLIKDYGDTTIHLTRKEYTQPIEDSLIKGTLTIVADGTIVSPVTLNYIAKFPKYILKTDSIFVTKPSKQPLSLIVGADIGGNTKQFIVAPTIGLITPKGYMYSIGYDISQKTYTFGLRKTIRLKK